MEIRGMETGGQGRRAAHFVRTRGPKSVMWLACRVHEFDSRVLRETQN
jgi:hypothetical protein